MPIAAHRVVTWRLGEGRDARGNTAILSFFFCGPDAGNRFSGVYNAGEENSRAKIEEEKRRWQVGK